MNETQTLTRKQLYDLVWSTPLAKLSKKYELSDNGLRRICVNMEIPLPTSGHWMRLQNNKEVAIPPLPVTYTGNNEVSLPLRPEGEPITPSNPVQALAFKLRRDASLSFDVPGKLHTKNPLVLTAKERLTGKELYSNQGLIGCGRDELDIKVGADNALRILRFADTLIKLINARGHQVNVAAMDTHAVVNGQKIKILFREKLKRTIIKGTRFNTQELHPTGQLLFRIDGFYGRQWTDGKETLEYYLPEIIAFLEIDSIRRNKMDEERTKQHLEYERKQQQKKELQELKEKDLVAFSETLQKAERWHKAVNLRNYIAEMEARGIATPQWLAWAKLKADWYDPFIEADDEMLQDINRDTLKQVNHRNW